MLAPAFFKKSELYAFLRQIVLASVRIENWHLKCWDTTERDDNFRGKIAVSSFYNIFCLRPLRKTEALRGA